MGWAGCRVALLVYGCLCSAASAWVMAHLALSGVDTQRGLSCWFAISGRRGQPAPSPARPFTFAAQCPAEGLTYRQRLSWIVRAWPVKFVVTTKPRHAAKIDDLANPLHRVAVRHIVNVRDKDAAKRLKARLDTLLLGDSAASKLRHGWRDVDDPDVTWDLLLAEALRLLHLDGFDEAEKQRRIRRVYEKQMRGFRRRG